MSATTEFNSLTGKEVSRKYLTGLIGRARKEKSTEVISRLSGMLKNNPGIDRFVIKITNQIKENPPAKKKTKPATVKRNPASKQKPVTKPLQRTIRKAKPTGLNSPEVHSNPNSLAYRLANKPENVEYYNIADHDIAEYLGNIEKKQKESVVISLTGGQGSMKTRHCFQLMNAFGQNYKIGHASIEEHPESKLYLDKATQYLNNRALQSIVAPEIKTMSDLDKLIRENDVIIIDSFTKVQEMCKGFEVDKDLRKKYNGKIFIVIFQQTTDGKMRGGSKSQFDADIVLFTEKKDDYRDNYIYADKNRYQDKPLDGLHYNIFSGSLIRKSDPNRKLTFNVQ
ncbi:hypothetical protein [Flavobacterium cerinum]|uniref:Uncharacterized protein n=1 Tax=Flavobacterium cerinum TaxID=2502784 RepID=A0ABY5ITV1_9FLAO|nr:hypothetical protein [Flavobacterium cerinum]UUC45592.1 hypothetical protein NOX80_18470 [Flavobacterium cerinum]